MSKPTVINAICENCGVDVRENTTFCYHCGVPVVEVDESVLPLNGADKLSESDNREVLDDLADRLRNEELEADDQLAAAAAKRKRARISPRKPKEFVWEPVEETENRLPLLIAVMIAVATLGIVFVTVLWK